jgi:hypothetical protein
MKMQEKTARPTSSQPLHLFLEGGEVWAHVVVRQAPQGERSGVSRPRERGREPEPRASARGRSRREGRAAPARPEQPERKTEAARPSAPQPRGRLTPRSGLRSPGASKYREDSKLWAGRRPNRAPADLQPANHLSSALASDNADNMSRKSGFIDGPSHELPGRHRQLPHHGQSFSCGAVWRRRRRRVVTEAAHSRWGAHAV